MLFKNILFTTAFAVLAAASPLSRRDIWLPKIELPDKSTVLVKGEKFMITWNTSNPPDRVTGGGKGSLTLTKADYTYGPGDLLKDIDLYQGSVEINVPTDDKVTPGFYFLTLFGNSGNVSENFCITDKAENAEKDCPPQEAADESQYSTEEPSNEGGDDSQA